MTNCNANATNSIAKPTNSTAKPTNSIAKPMNSIANGTNSIAILMNSIAILMNSIANGTNSIAKATNPIAKTCNISLFLVLGCIMISAMTFRLHFVNIYDATKQNGRCSVGTLYMEALGKIVFPYDSVYKFE